MIFLLKILSSVVFGCLRVLEVLGGIEFRNGLFVVVGINVNIYKSRKRF